MQLYLLSAGGLVIKGWLEQLGSWQWMYLFLVGYGVVTELIQFFIPEEERA